MISRRRVLRLAAGAGALGLAGPVRACERTRWRGVVLGADAVLIIEGVPQHEGRRLVRVALAEAARLERIFSLHCESALVRLNRHGYLAAPPPELLACLTTAGFVHRASGGAFDPTIEPLWRAYAASRGRPASATRAAALALVDWSAVTIEAAAVRFTRPGMALTLNGIAQGVITDRVAAVLRSEGLRSVLVSMGEPLALGPPAEGVWRVGLAEHGDDPAKEVLPLKAGAVATSAPNGTCFDAAATVGHLLDPRSGRPASGWRRVSVHHSSAAVADAVSTAAAILPGEAIDALLDSVGGASMIAVAADGGRLMRAARGLAG